MYHNIITLWGNKAFKHFLRHTTKLPIKNYWVIRIKARLPFLYSRN